MMWVYAVCERPELPPPRRRGLAQAPLEGVAERRLLAVVTKHVHAPGEPALDALWAHEQVVERLMTERAVLPMRFGTKLPDAAALRAALAARYDALLAALDRVRGRVELGVRAMELAGEDGDGSGRAQVVTPATTGREYLLGKLADNTRAEQAVAALHEPLSELAVDARRRPAQGSGELLRAAYLVDRDMVPRFRGTVEHLQRRHPRVALLCTGPWPPYSFVALLDETGPNQGVQGAR
jgi:hypothetical protein